MNTKINGIDTRPVGVGSATPVSRGRAPAGLESGEPGASRPEINITEGARQLAALEKQLGEIPEVDEARVSAVSLSIERGRYQVDPERIAAQLLRMDHELSQAGSGGDE